MGNPTRAPFIGIFCISIFRVALLIGLGGSSLAADLNREVDSLLALDPLEGTSWSVLFADAETGQVVAAHDPKRLLVPASVTKLWTTAAAFRTLGADYKFVTKVAAAGPPDASGALRGSLQIICGGDPMFELKTRRGFGQPAQKKIAVELFAQGLRRVEGDLEIVVNAFERSCGNGVWEMGDLREGFAPTVDGAGFNSNVCNVEIAPGEHVDAPAEVHFEPQFAPITVRNNIVTVGKGNESWIEYRVTPCEDELEINGVMALQDDPQYIWFPLQEPARYLGLAIRNALEQKGITISGSVQVLRNVSPASHILLEVSSAPMSNIAAIVNKDSDNYLAEYLLMAVAKESFGHGSTEAGVRAIQRFARGLEIHRDAFSLEDGCGLSRQNIFSAEAVVKLLRAMIASEEGNDFEASLSQSGVDGTLTGRLSANGMLGRVHAKTGTMTNVSSIAGYIGLDNGKRIAFAIISNNFRCSRNYVRNTQDDLIRAVFRASN